MITIGKNRVLRIARSNKAVAYIYYGAALVYQAIRSCFGRGFWINAKPWINNDAWKN